MKIKIAKARPMCRDNPVESVIIEISETTPDLSGDLSEYEKFYSGEAKKLADALFVALPGGIADRLLAEMMSRRAVLFAVPLIEKK